MKRIKPFTYCEVETVPEAVEILAREGHGANALAGGTDLLVRMKRGVLAPTALVNLKRIPGLDGIEKEQGKDLRIGALVSISGIEHSPLIQASHPVLAEAAGGLGSPSIRNLGTLGGNIGRASPAADMAPSLIVLRARVLLEGLQGKREMDIGGFFKGPGATALSPGELITAFLLPDMAPGSGAAYMRLGRRQGMDCTLVGVAVFVTLSEKDEGVTDARVALAAVAPVPLRAKRAEEALLSGSLTTERMKTAARAAAEDCFPITDIRASGSYRKEMVEVLTYRGLERAIQLAKGGAR
jgi:CO/xanthine dehydrogenase FAD-binding subunit